MKINISDNETKEITTYVSGKSTDKVESLAIRGNKKVEKIDTQIGVNFDILSTEIENSALDKQIAHELIGLLRDLKQARESNNTEKQKESKRKLESFWSKFGSTVMKVAQTTAHLTTALKYFGITLNNNGLNI